MSPRVAKVFDHFSIKKLFHKQMLQILPVAIAEVNTGNYQTTYWIKSTKSYILCKRNYQKEITKTI